jgi:hypothetical protein
MPQILSTVPPMADSSRNEIVPQEPRGPLPLRAPEHPLSTKLLTEIKAEFPEFVILPKQGDRLSAIIDRLLRIVTLGGQRSYLTRYHTVLGYRLYVPLTWDQLDDAGRYILLCHERVHLRQRRRYGSWGMALLYLLPIVPIGLAWGRARLEWEAYRETLRATAEVLGNAAVRSPELKKQILDRFTGPDYGWMWPFPAQLSRWFDAALDELERNPVPPVPPAPSEPHGHNEGPAGGESFDARGGGT